MIGPRSSELIMVGLAGVAGGVALAVAIMTCLTIADCRHNRATCPPRAPRVRDPDVEAMLADPERYFTRPARQPRD